MIRVIHAGDSLREYNGSEREFPVKLTEAFPVISDEEAERLVNMVYEEAFGREGSVKIENLSFAEAVYNRIQKEVRRKSNIRKRIWLYFY